MSLNQIKDSVSTLPISKDSNLEVKKKSNERRSKQGHKHLLGRVHRRQVGEVGFGWHRLRKISVSSGVTSSENQGVNS